MHPKTTDKQLAWALFLLFFTVYLLTYSGALHSSDGQAMFSVSESLVRRGVYDINQIRWMGLQQGTFGTDGNLYCRKGLGTSLAALPLAWLGLLLPAWGVVQTTMLLNVVITALTGSVIFLYVRRLGYRQSTACITALVFCLGTLAWPYAKYFFSEPLTGLCLIGAAYFLVQRGPSQTGRVSLWRPALSGCFLGLALATRFANAVLIPIYLVALVVQLLRSRSAADWPSIRSNPRIVISATWAEVLAFAAPLLFWAALMAAYNYLRFGSPLITGYLPEESFSAPWLEGILGLLVSPGRGILFYCPILLACIPALPQFVRRHRVQAFLVLFTAASYLLLYGKWFMWHGGFAWGPRFLLPVIPLLCVTVAPVVERLAGKTRALFWALFGISVAVQLPGLSVHFIHHQEALLDAGLPLFDPVTFFHPRYSQLWGTLSFLSPENLDFAWVQATAGIKLDWISLTSSVLLVAVCAWVVAVSMRGQVPSPLHKLSLFVLVPLLVAGGTTLLLSRYNNDGHADHVQMLKYLQATSEPVDAIIQNNPPETAILQNHYKGRLPSYGLFEGEGSLPQDTLTLLDTVSARHPRIWLIPGQLPPNINSLDLWFSQQGWSAAHSAFGAQRLTLYSRP
jgi:hypothetical protein